MAIRVRIIETALVLNNSLLLYSSSLYTNLITLHIEDLKTFYKKVYIITKVFKDELMIMLAHIVFI